MRGSIRVSEKVFILIFTLFINLSVTGCYKAPPRLPYRVEELERLMEQAERAALREEHERAIVLYRDALKKARLIQDDRTSLIALINLSRLLSKTGHLKEAEEVIDTAKDLKARTRLPRELLEEADLEEARIALLGGRHDASEAIVMRLINSSELNIRIKALNLLSRLCIQRTRYQDALVYLKKALEINKGTLRLEEANSHRLLGVLYIEAGDSILDFPQAESALRQALEIDRSLGLPEKIGLDLEVLGRLYMDTGDIVRAREYLSRSLEIWHLRQDNERAETILRLLGEIKDR
mgnify:CR=1 FL=1